MGYSVDYSGGQVQYRRDVPKKSTAKLLVKCTAVLLAGFLLLYGYNYCKKSGRIFAPQEVWNAAEGLVADIRSGGNVTEAVEAFYEDVFEGTLISIS